ncbi:MAG: sodium:proton exchanger [Phycisphaerae bacterium]|nr:sodium:proton exchanger [Phycisphaerae bacterium]
MSMPPTLLAAAEMFPLLTLLAGGFAAAWLCGLLAHRVGLSPIVGYLVAGVLIGPSTPGFVGDVDLAQQVAELGVILLMFGVGLHFHVRDLWAVRAIAVPGAIVQVLVATGASIGLFHLLGWAITEGLILGLAMAVASTVVLLRVLMDRGVLQSSHGHVAVGWLIVEDLLMVLVVVLVPLAGGLSGEAAEGATTVGSSPIAAISLALLKAAVFVAILLLAGSRVVPWILGRVARLRSAELFTLTVLVLSITVAVGSSVLFGVSVALGAFLAGVVVGQSPTSHQAAADALPMRDAFAVVFFVSVGMLFDPGFVLQQPWLVLSALAVVLLVKPLAALAMVAILGRPLRTGLTVAIGLGQIGEFSFIVAQVATANDLLPEAGMDVLVATALLSIALNPILFARLDAIERTIARVPWLWRLLNRRHDARLHGLAPGVGEVVTTMERPLAVVVGYGPVGRLVDALLQDAGLEVTVVDLNIDTVRTLLASGRRAVYGDAMRREVLEQAGVRRAVHLLVTFSRSEEREALVRLARGLNPDLEITVRAHYLGERAGLLRAGASGVVLEEAEAGLALARRVLERRGLEPPQIDRLVEAMRVLWKASPGADDPPRSDASS